jgi:hypothetical protein
MFNDKLQTAKNTEKLFSRNISGKTCSQAICVWATLIQVNQDISASVWWTAHARKIMKNRIHCHFKTTTIHIESNVMLKKIYLSNTNRSNKHNKYVLSQTPCIFYALYTTIKLLCFIEQNGKRGYQYLIWGRDTYYFVTRKHSDS